MEGRELGNGKKGESELEERYREEESIQIKIGRESVEREREKREERERQKLTERDRERKRERVERRNSEKK